MNVIAWVTLILYGLLCVLDLIGIFLDDTVKERLKNLVGVCTSSMVIMLCLKTLGFI